MKKTLRLLALSLVLVTMVALFASCGGPAKDPADAKAALEENDYVALKDDTVTPGLMALAGIKDVDCVVSGTNSDGEHVTIVYFESKDAANTAWEKIQEYAEDDKKDEESDWSIKKSGIMVYYGTSAAIKAAK